ncbi:hypothetical protein ACGFIJ_15125 [Microbispora bryophytorum]|uniref:hypothetical protein n=1 Tax=Microbispora bryophytorum TaxID=1460882 RepID=UPI003716E677
MSTAVSVSRSPAVVAAERLRCELARLGVAADVHEGDGLALLLVGVHLVVWCERGPVGWRYRWWTGGVSARSGRWLYTGCRAAAVKTAALRVTARYAELRGDPSPCPLSW